MPDNVGRFKMQNMSRVWFGAWWHFRAIGICLTVLIATVSMFLFFFSVLYPYLEPPPRLYTPDALDYQLQVHYGGSHWNSSTKTLLVKDIDVPMICNNVMFHGLTTSYLSKEPIFIRRQTEWIKNFPDDCFFTVSLDHPFVYKEAPQGLEKADAVYVPWINCFRVKFDGMSLLNSMARNGMLQRVNSDTTPWILFTDLDVLPMNKEKSIDSLLERVERGLDQATAEERLCIEEPADFKCPSYAQNTNIKRPRSMEDIGQVIALDHTCFDTWMYNSGVFLFKPSRLAGFIASAVLWSFNDTSLPHHFDYLDQGRQDLLYREVFDLHPDVARLFCGPPIKDTRWGPSLESDELVFLRSLNLSKALTHPVYRIAAQTWFPDGRFWPGEPTSIAIVASRWMNSPTCNHVNAFTPKRRHYFGFTCGDMFAHFSGCDKNEYNTSSFRDLIVDEEWCRNILPFETNDEDTGPFDYDEWIEAAKPAEKVKSNVLDPTRPIQYGD